MKATLFLGLLSLGWVAFAQQIGDGPIVKEHLDQAAIERGTISFEDLLTAGEKLFVAKFNTYDGQGRPGTTGHGVSRDPEGVPRFVRTSSPEANSCAGCHNDPFVGGAGDFVANVFVLAQTLDPVTMSVAADFSNERNTLGMHGSGAIEMLAREMTDELIAIRDAAIQQAQDEGQTISRALFAKGISFGTIRAAADGSLDTSAVVGVDEADLIIKPFHQKGVVTSVRQFSNNAFNHHHGMQSVERFGVDRTGTDDFDGDGVKDELTVGDITAVTLWQTSLGVPGQVIPNDGTVARAILVGERTFGNIGCADCHTPYMTLNNPTFTEPNPYNPDGNLQPDQVSRSIEYDMTSQGDKPYLESRYDGSAVVRAFTDLKRHNLCDADYNHYCNEELEQDGVATELFLTRKLWDVGNTAPYGHRGDLTTITEAISAHGGEGRASREAFFALSDQSRAEVVEFLKSLQILPPGTESLVVDGEGTAKSKAATARALGLPGTNDFDIKSPSRNWQ